MLQLSEISIFREGVARIIPSDTGKDVQMNTKIMSRFIAVAMVLMLGLASPVFARSIRGKMHDATITSKVKFELAKDVRLRTLTGIHVDTYNGVVTLSGTVRNRVQRRAATDVAMSVRGVTNVRNELSVKPVS